jgi:hypothetical protein
MLQGITEKKIVTLSPVNPRKVPFDKTPDLEVTWNDV